MNAKTRSISYSTSDPKFSKLIQDIRKVWQAIGHEVEGHCEDQEQMVESCVDADRLLLTVNEAESHAYHKELCARYGHDKVLTFLARYTYL